MAFSHGMIISLFMVSLPLLCQSSEVSQTEGKQGDERTQINLASTGGQILLFFGAVIIIDLFLTVFAFGYLSEETKKKYRRQGILSPFSQRLRPSPILKKLFRRRPSKLALTLRRKLQQLGPNRHAKRHFGKRDVESEIEREDMFRPAIDDEFNDDQVQQSLDVVDTAFGVMNVESEECRMRSICEMERVATRYPIMSFLVQTVGPYVKGLEKYEDAVQRGRNGEDCALYYDKCQYSLDRLPKLFQ